MSLDWQNIGKNELPEQDLNKFQEITELWPPPGLKRVVFVREGLQKSRSHVCWKRSTNETQKSSKMITNEVRDSQNHAQSEYQNRLDFRDAKSSKSDQKRVPTIMPKSGFFSRFLGFLAQGGHRELPRVPPEAESDRKLNFLGWFVG